MQYVARAQECTRPHQASLPDLPLPPLPTGLVFTPASVPYLRSEYGKEYDYDAPVGGC